MANAKLMMDAITKVLKGADDVVPLPDPKAGKLSPSELGSTRPDARNYNSPSELEGTGTGANVANPNYNPFQQELIDSGKASREGGVSPQGSVFDDTLEGNRVVPAEDYSQQDIINDLLRQARPGGEVKGSQPSQFQNNITRVEDGVAEGAGPRIDFEGEQMTKQADDIKRMLEEGTITEQDARIMAKDFGTSSNINKYAQEVVGRFKQTFPDIESMMGATKQGTFESKLRDGWKKLSRAAAQARNPNIPQEARRKALADMKSIDEWLTKGGKSEATGRQNAPDVVDPGDPSKAQFSRTDSELSKQRMIDAQQGPGIAEFGKSGELIDDSGIEEIVNPTFPNVLNLGRHGTAGVAIPKNKGGRMSLEETIQFLEQERKRVGQ